MLTALVLLACAHQLPVGAAALASPADGQHGGHAGHGGHQGHAGHHGQGMTHDFNDAARFAAAFDDPRRDLWQKPADVVALLGLKPGQVVADLGAGTGYFLPHLLKAVAPGGTVVGLDVAEGMVAWMNARIARDGLTGAVARKVAFDDPGLSPESVDVLLTVDTWHHVDGREAYARKVAAGLRPGGRFVVVDFTMDSPEGPPPELRLAPEKVLAELGAAGFEARLVDEALPYQYVVIATRR